MRLIRAHDPDLIVSTYPGVTAVLGELRRKGRLDVPCYSSITDLAGLQFWAHPGIDLHFITHPESAEEVEQIAGSGQRALGQAADRRPRSWPPARDPMRAGRSGLPPSATGDRGLRRRLGRGRPRRRDPRRARGARTPPCCVCAAATTSCARKVSKRFDDEPRLR